MGLWISRQGLVELTEFFCSPVCVLLVGMGGFEPPAPRSRSEYSTRLSHIPNP